LTASGAFTHLDSHLDRETSPPVEVYTRVSVSTFSGETQGHSERERHMHFLEREERDEASEATSDTAPPERSSFTLMVLMALTPDTVLFL